jgi:hypothetical protein
VELRGPFFPLSVHALLAYKGKFCITSSKWKGRRHLDCPAVAIIPSFISCSELSFCCRLFTGFPSRLHTYLILYSSSLEVFHRRSGRWCQRTVLYTCHWAWSLYVPVVIVSLFINPFTVRPLMMFFTSMAKFTKTWGRTEKMGPPGAVLFTQKYY